MVTILITTLILLLIGAVPARSHTHRMGWDSYPGGGLSPDPAHPDHSSTLLGRI